MAEAPPWLSPHGDGVVVSVKAVPRSRQTKALGIQDGALRIQIAAAPHKRQSNAALCAYLAEAAGVRPSAVEVRRGSSGARKLIGIAGDPAAIGDRLARRMAEDLGDAGAA